MAGYDRVGEPFDVNFDSFGLSLRTLPEADGLSLSILADKLNGSVALRIFRDTRHVDIFRLMICESEPSGVPHARRLASIHTLPR